MHPFLILLESLADLQNDTVRNAFPDRRYTAPAHSDVPSQAQLRILSPPPGTELSIQDIQSFLVPTQEAVWNKNYGYAMKKNPPSEETTVGKNYRAAIKVHDPTTPLERFLQRFGDGSSEAVSASEGSQGSNSAGSRWRRSPTDGDLDGLAKQFEDGVLIALDKIGDISEVNLQ
jgi:hypothetical protein